MIDFYNNFKETQHSKRTDNTGWISLLLLQIMSGLNEQCFPFFNAYIESSDKNSKCEDIFEKDKKCYSHTYSQNYFVFCFESQIFSSAF